jgi:ribosome-binding protein aMBF1 (putative translation factor)
MKSWRDIRDAKLSVERFAQLDAELEEKGTVAARPYLRALIASDLRMARADAGLTPERVAARIGKSASFVRESESGRTDVSERYLFTFMRACRLPERWKRST